MKLDQQIPQRVVEYFGMQLVVPFDMRFLAIDADGVVTAHEYEPWWEPGYYEGYELGQVAKVTVPSGFKWEDSLCEFPPMDV